MPEVLTEVLGEEGLEDGVGFEIEDQEEAPMLGKKWASRPVPQFEKVVVSYCQGKGPLFAE